MNERFAQYTALISRDGDWYVALCPELDVASQGTSVEDARANLIEAVELFLESASAQEASERLRGETYVSSIEVRVA
jgi:predicted RNase H-like HicB family nuclease